MTVSFTSEEAEQAAYTLLDAAVIMNRIARASWAVELCEWGLRLAHLASSYRRLTIDVPQLSDFFESFAFARDGAAIERLCVAAFAADSLPELRVVAERAVSRLEVVTAVVGSVENSPGITQFALRESLGISKEETAHVVAQLEKLGKIRRVPAGRTNRLYLVSPGEEAGPV